MAGQVREKISWTRKRRRLPHPFCVTEAHVAMLEAMGRDEFQGFLFGHPEPRIPV